MSDRHRYCADRKQWTVGVNAPIATSDEIVAVGRSPVTKEGYEPLVQRRIVVM
jgi:hypothetical protein